jgi:antitoxin component YwqK of YwqJK toxin-antitoxin module
MKIKTFYQNNLKCSTYIDHHKNGYINRIASYINFRLTDFTFGLYEDGLLKDDEFYHEIF